MFHGLRALDTERLRLIASLIFHVTSRRLLDSFDGRVKFSSLVWLCHSLPPHVIEKRRAPGLQEPVYRGDVVRKNWGQLKALAFVLLGRGDWG